MGVIIDFGLSQAFTTGTEDVCGTPGYIPPETWETGRWVPKGDIYSMSLVCFQVLSDQSGSDDVAPFVQAHSQEEEEFKQRASQSLPWDMVPPDLEQRDAVIDWLAAGINKRVKDRPTARAILAFPWFVANE